MNIYKSLKLLILIGSGILLACSPKSTDKIKPSHPIQTQAQQTVTPTFQGLQAYKDPQTGKFVQMPTTNQPQNNNNNSVTSLPAVTQQNNNHKNSNIMIIPAPYRSNQSNANNN